VLAKDHNTIDKPERYNGTSFYASPVTLGEAKPGTKFPGVILVHGDGGTAFVE